MGNEPPKKYNISGDVRIQIKLNKVCYLPGETIQGSIILTPKFNLIEEVLTNPKLHLKITQYQYYSYTVGSDTEQEKEELILVSMKLNFDDFLNNTTSNKINIPVNIILPKHAYPSIFFNKDNYVKHYFSVEYSHFKVKRTIMFIVKNNLNFNTKNNSLKAPMEVRKKYNKSKLFFSKGSCVLKIKMPKNYFLYNEKIEYNINLNCKELKIGIQKFRVTLYRVEKNNLPKERFKSRRKNTVNIYYKDYNINKKQDIYNITDFLAFSNKKHAKSNSPCPYDIYKVFEAHGLFEVNEQNFNFLYPSCVGGLLSIDYFLKFKIYFDSAWTYDESINIPIDFFSIIEDKKNNSINNNTKISINNNTNNSINNNTNNSINIIENENNIISGSNLINNNNANQNSDVSNKTNSINDNCVSNDFRAPPALGNNNIEKNKNFMEDDKKDSLDMKDWVII